MDSPLTRLIDHLDLEQIEENLFRGQSLDLGWGRLFGGHVLAQALLAAERTVPEDRACHSLHAYFLRSGDVDRPIVYTVDRIRDGRSFTTRRVVAVQKGKAIFNLSASFHGAEQGFDHHDVMPASTDPGELLGEDRLAEAIAHLLPDKLAKAATRPRPIEIRPVDPLNPLKPELRPPHKQIWLRANGPLPDDPRLHRHLLAYSSDFHLLVTSLQPHGVSWLNPGMQVASLDHSLYFLRPFRMDEWLLYDIDSPSAHGARGLARGRLFNQRGELVATTVQEGLIRDRRG